MFVWKSFSWLGGGRSGRVSLTRNLFLSPSRNFLPPFLPTSSGSDEKYFQSSSRRAAEQLHFQFGIFFPLPHVAFFVYPGRRFSVALFTQAAIPRASAATSASGSRHCFCRRWNSAFAGVSPFCTSPPLNKVLVSRGFVFSKQSTSLVFDESWPTVLFCYSFWI